jgi:hypothetical protein
MKRLLLLLLLLITVPSWAQDTVVFKKQAANQYNLEDEQSTENDYWSVGIDTTTDKWCGSTEYEPTSSYTIRKLELYIKRYNSGTQTITPMICATDYTGCVEADSTISVSGLSTDYTWVPVTFAVGKALTAETSYRIVLEADGIHATNNLRWAANDTVSGVDITSNRSTACGYETWDSVDTGAQHNFRAYSYGSPAAPGECVGYLVCQNFEGTGGDYLGYDNQESWVETVTDTVDQDYTSTVLRGSQSLYISSSSGDNRTTRTFGNNNSAWTFFRYRPVTHSGDDGVVFTRDTSDASSWSMIHKGTTNLMQFWHGGYAGDSASTVTEILTGTTYYFWVYYAKGTGANGVLKVYVDTDRTRPADPEINMTDGPGTAAYGKIIVRVDDGGSGIFDQVLVKTTEIGDVPE